MSYNTIRQVQHAVVGQVGTSPAALATAMRITRIKCNAGAGAYKLRDGGASGQVIFDETLAVGDQAFFEDAPIRVQTGIYVDTVPASGDISIYWG